MRGISVIVACYKAGDFLREAVESIERVKPSLPYEIIVVDDASNDKLTAFVLNELAMTGRIKLAELSCNQGQSAARNHALQMANYDYIFPLDADDKMNPQEPGFFDDAVSRLENHPETITVYSKLKFFGARHAPWILPAYNEYQMLLHNMIPVCGVFRRSDALQIGGYKEDLRYSEDWELWIALHADRFRHQQPRNVEIIPKTHYLYRQHTNGENVSERQRMKIMDLMAQVSARSLELYDHHFGTTDAKELTSLHLQRSSFLKNVFRYATGNNPLDVIEFGIDWMARRYPSWRKERAATISEMPQHLIR